MVSITWIPNVQPMRAYRVVKRRTDVEGAEYTFGETVSELSIAN